MAVALCLSLIPILVDRAYKSLDRNGSVLYTAVTVRPPLLCLGQLSTCMPLQRSLLPLLPAGPQRAGAAHRGHGALRSTAAAATDVCCCCR